MKDNSQTPSLNDSHNSRPVSGSLTDGLFNRPSMPPTPKKWLWAMVAVVTIVVLAAGFMYFRAQRQLNIVKKELETAQNDPTAKTRQGNEQLIQKVAELISLPADETPTIATVNDLDKLRGQAFFDNAELGDKVLIYAKAKKAILYRPSQNKIIELAPLSDSGSIPGSADANTEPTAPSANTVDQ